ncbi:MAG: ParB/RepB/Spo0J family partition protein [Deltaproteobacteria bacterium]|nr:ParB/RepB/Spo0J family partition protein [Deltaproteobacteria bacterium]
MSDSSKRRALGRGLDALLPSAAPVPSSSTNIFMARIEELHSNRSQPRSRFDEEKIDELAASLKEVGMLEPVLVRKRAQGGFEIVAGERRWRAAQRAGIYEIPVFVRELSETEAFEAALVENLQREDLNPLEVARGFQRLINEHSHSQDSIAKLLGKDRSTVANALRLLKLPESVAERIESDELSEGHGRALLSAGENRLIEKLAQEAIAKGWSVRETERRARGAATAQKEREKSQPTRPNPNIRDLEERLSRSLGTRVVVADRNGKGHLNISFSSYDELDRILEVLTG